MMRSMVISHKLAVSGIFLTANREENLILLLCNHEEGSGLWSRLSGEGVVREKLEALL